jgi:TolB-like protein/DNA-binding winged helix-turn-helix (wHTH) protein/Tfp pilus assembly protein PilF/rhodanese-related sulfurtransferase
MMDSLHAQEVYHFGAFQLCPGLRRLTANGKSVSLSSRAFDILQLLVEQRDRNVTRAEILSVVWRGTTVDDNNLAVQMSALRRTLAKHAGGAQIIVTIPGQGYRFVAPLEAAPADQGNHGADVLPAGPRRRRTLPIVLAALLLLAAGLWVTSRGPASDDNLPRLSIAVLPFRNLGPDASQTYLADAISDDLTTDLSHIPGSMVIARESADAYKGRAVSTATIGRALGVRYLLEGSLVAEASTVHVNAQLITARTGAHLWASAFDVPRADLGGVRAEIVRRLAAVLGYTLVQVESARSLHDRPTNPDAIDLYLRARSILDRGSDLTDLQQAQALLEQAIAQAGNFGDALATLGSLLLDKIDGFDDADEWADHARAQAVIGKALALYPQNPAAIIANGKLSYVDGRLSQAQESFRLALTLEPDNLSAHLGLAKCARKLGRMQEMVDERRIVLRFDPTGPKLGISQHLIGMGLLMLGKPQDAIVWFDKAGAQIADPAQPGASLGWREYRELYLIAAHYLTGDTVRARRDYAAYAARWPRRTVWHMAAYDSRALAALPGHRAYLAALHESGMPLYANENADISTGPIDKTRAYGDFDHTPGTLQGATRISTDQLHHLLQTQPQTLVLDVGRGVATIPGAILVWPQGVWGDREQLLLHAAESGRTDPERTIVILGDGPLGWDSYNAAADLVSQGFRRVLWYRGGEEAWAASGYGFEDRRSP